MHWAEYIEKLWQGYRAYLQFDVSPSEATLDIAALRLRVLGGPRHSVSNGSGKTNCVA